jgi:hypothetical protein
MTREVSLDHNWSLTFFDFGSKEPNNIFIIVDQRVGKQSVGQRLVATKSEIDYTEAFLSSFRRGSEQ